MAEQEIERTYQFTKSELMKLLGEAGGAATRPLMEDHPDYEFPGERVGKAIDEFVNHEVTQAMLGRAEVVGQVAALDNTARIHVSALLRRPNILPEDRAAAEEWLRSQPAPAEPAADTSMEAIRERHDTEPGTREDFEAEHGQVKPADGEG